MDTKKMSQACQQLTMGEEECCLQLSQVKQSLKPPLAGNFGELPASQQFIQMA